MPEDEPISIDRDKLIAHAHKILNSNVKGNYIAKEINMNTRQFYDYRNGVKNIDTAYLDTLIKFEKLYQKIKHEL